MAGLESVKSFKGNFIMEFLKSYSSIELDFTMSSTFEQKLTITNLVFIWNFDDMAVHSFQNGWIRLYKLHGGVIKWRTLEDLNPV